MLYLLQQTTNKKKNKPLMSIWKKHYFFFNLETCVKLTNYRDQQSLCCLLENGASVEII